MNEQKEYELGQLLTYEQPTPYIVESTKYNDEYATPVLTAGKTFILGYTNEDFGIYDALPVIIFDDFTTASRFVNFKFKVKSSAMKILTPNTELVDPKYIYYRMQVIEYDHSTHKRYWISQYSKIKLSIPSLPEQRHIVAHIEEQLSQVDNGVETLEKIKLQLDVYRNSVLKDAFEGKWKFQYRKEVSLPSCMLDVVPNEISKLAPIPKEWEYVHLSHLGRLSRGKSKHRPRNDPRLFEDGKYPFFQTGDVKAANKYLMKSEKKYGEFGLSQSQLWPKDTLCITIAANIAETCFLGVEGCFPDSIVGFSPDEQLVSKEYIRYFIESSKLRLWAYAPATAQKNINLTTLENLIVPYCSMDEQQHIVREIESRLSVCGSIYATVTTALQQADGLQRSILKKSFEE